MSKKNSNRKAAADKSRHFHADVPCQCGHCEEDAEHETTTFQCSVCQRTMPNCYGAADKFYEACDECVADRLVVELLTAQDLLLTARRPTVQSILEARGALTRALYDRGAEVAGRGARARAHDETLRGLEYLKDLLAGSRSADSLEMASKVIVSLIEIQAADPCVR
jgi:hypothetical protein